MLIAAFTPEAWTSAAAVAAVTLVLLVRLRNRSRRAGSESVPREAAPRDLGLRHAGASVASTVRSAERQLVEHYEFAREFEARLDVKRALLEQLLHDADERIARLESLEQAAKRSESAESQAQARTSRY